MNKFYLSALVGASFLITGCVKPNAMTNFNYSNFYSKSLQHTSKNDIIRDNGVVAMLNATYLNKVDKTVRTSNFEVFLVGLFFTNTNGNIDKTFKDEYKLSLNNQKAESIAALSKEDEMFSKMPLYNPWAKYYIVKFNKNNLNKKFLEKLTYKETYTKFEYKELKLKLENSSGESTIVTFQKAQ